MLWEEKNYDDIIDLPHHVSENHAHMSMRGRAAQFSAFAALKGYDEAVAEAARRTDSRREPDEDTAREINERLVWLIEHLAELPRVELTYFVPDERKAGGAYVPMSGAVRIYDSYAKELEFVGGKRVPINDIYSIEILADRDDRDDTDEKA